MSSIRAGEVREAPLVQGLHRGQIVQYAGASGDFNPLHTDEIFASQIAGRPAVIAHGMLTMGLAGRLVTDWFGAENIVSLSARFKTPVSPGDTLTGQATVRDIESVGDQVMIMIDLSVANQRGEVVLTGSAEVRQPV